MYVGASQPHTHKLRVRDVRTRRTPAPGQTCSRAPHAPLPPVFLNREVAVFLQADGGRSPETRFLILNSEAYCSQITAALDTNSRSGSFPIAMSETLANAGLQREGRCEHSGCTALCRSGGRGDLPQTHASPGNQRPQAPRQRNRFAEENAAQEPPQPLPKPERRRPPLCWRTERLGQHGLPRPQRDAARHPHRKYPVH